MFHQVTSTKRYGFVESENIMIDELRTDTAYEETEMVSVFHFHPKNSFSFSFPEMLRWRGTKQFEYV